MSNYPSFLNASSNYQTYEIVLAIIFTVYFGLYVMVSNHYVFKQKIQLLFLNSSFQSKALFQFIIDFLTNLTPLTFIICELIIANSDNALSVMLFSDVCWSGILTAILVYKGIVQKEHNNWKLFTLKNIIFIVIIYLSIAIHYISQTYFVSLGLSLVFIYLANLAIEAHEDKFISAVQMLFNYKKDTKRAYKDKSDVCLPTIQFLSKYFSPRHEQLKHEMKSYERKLKTINLKTKAAVTQKLLKIALTVHLSKQKMEYKAKRDVKYYYGSTNGTILEKSKKLIMQKKTIKMNEQMEQEMQQNLYHPQQYHNSIIFYIFPVRLFQNSKIISVIFSLIINLGFGVLLSFTVQMGQTFKYGKYCQILYGLILLPLLPTISKQQFFNSMNLSSLWKYCIYGISLIVNCTTNPLSSILMFNFQPNNLLKFLPVIQIISFIMISFNVLKKNTSCYLIVFIWILGIIVNCILIFKFC